MTKNADMTSIFTLTIQKLQIHSGNVISNLVYSRKIWSVWALTSCPSQVTISEGVFFFLLFAKNIVLEKYTRKNLIMSYLAVSLSRANVPLIFMLWNWLWKLWNVGEHWLEMSWTLFLKLGVLLNLQQCRISSIYVNKIGNLLIIENVKGHIISMN